MKKSVSAKLPGKIVLTSSRANNFGEIDFDNLNLEKGVYLRDMQNTKLMKIKYADITTYSLHPDVILTNIAHLNTGFSISTLIINTLSRLNGITAEQGVTNVLVYPAFSLETGKYYDEGIEQEPNKIANNQEIAKKL
ncbi:retinol dehydrogenase 12-like protein [Rhizophagus irregularis DAOM 181602=DAOM 197198]|nr:retinol dehydrogenase 12-like protein [Rhizophagus irregularis DAOM 181602=DAOM 197198]